MAIQRPNRHIQNLEQLYYLRTPKQLAADGVLFKVDWNASVSASGTADLHVVTPTDDTLIAVDRSLQFDGATSLTATVYEEPTVDTKGSTILTAYNYNRTSTATSGAEFITDTTFSATGSTTLDVTRIPSSTGSVGTATARTSDLNTEAGHRILKPGADYLLRLVNNDDSNEANFTVKIIFHEGSVGS